MFSDLSPEARVPQDHPLRTIRLLVDAVLKELSPQFDALYSHTGRPSIAPEKLLRALLLQVLYTIRSERLLMEQLDDNLLFRWFVGLNMDDPIWDPSTFRKNRERLLGGDVAHAVFDQVLAQSRERDLLSDEHFTVDGTLIEAWAGQKSFQRQTPATLPSPPDDPGNPSIDCHGERRTNATHAATTDPEARLYKKAKGQGAKLASWGHVFRENRPDLVVDTRITQATGTAEREAALTMADAIWRTAGRVPHPLPGGEGRESMANLVFGCCLSYPFVDREGRRITWSSPEHVRDSAGGPSCAGERSPASG
jgi:transposase